MHNKYKDLVQNELAKREFVVLDLGCGEKKREISAIGVDLISYSGVDLVGDVCDILQAFPDGSVDKIYSSHFFEHLSDLSELLKTINRILKTGGALEITVPHHSNPFFYSDPTHKTFFGLYTMAYFCESDGLFFRTLPVYARIPGLCLEGVRLRFKSYRPRYLTHIFRKVLQSVFNSTNYMKEVYEDSFSNIFNCYEIEFKIVKR